MFSRSPRLLIGAVSLAVLAAVAATVLPGGAGGTTEVVIGPASSTELKTYSVDVDGTAVAGSPTIDVTTVVDNDARSQSLGAVQIRIPGDLTLDVSSLALNGVPLTTDRYLYTAPSGGELANVQVLVDLASERDAARGRGSDVGTITFTATRASAEICSPGSYTFQVAAKQANNFAGTGNDFVYVADPGDDLTAEVSGTCSLAFTGQPADAYSGQPITTVDFDEFAAPVAVQLRDGAGQPLTTTWSVALHLQDPAGTSVDFPAPPGTPSFTPGAPTYDGSTATFAPRVAVAGIRSFTLGATATVSGATVEADSTAFSVSSFGDVDIIVDCTEANTGLTTDEIDPAANLDCEGTLGGITVQTRGDKVFGIGDLTDQDPDGLPTFAVRFPTEVPGGETPVYARYLRPGPVSPWDAAEAFASIEYPGDPTPQPITDLCGIDYRAAGFGPLDADGNQATTDQYADPCADIAYDDDTFSLEYVVRFLADPTFRFR